MKQPCLALKRHNGLVEIAGIRWNLNLPPGCTGILFVFESKKAARDFWGKDVELRDIEVRNK